LAVALILAAGRGERLGADTPKALVQLGGRPLLQWSIDVLSKVEQIERIVVALPSGVPPPDGTIGVLGGAVRSDSVRRALAVAGEGDPIIVHDAARPMLSSDLVRATLAAVQAEGIDAAVAATPVTDTIKRADGDGLVSGTLDRSSLWAIQTPQVFERVALERALDVPDEVLAQATDDAWLIERAGGRVAIVASTPRNLKITTPLDLELAELLIARRDTE
jgi:2-C-methyl-D-erythritol 4-phosphate cytidylyltransferase